VFIAPCSAISLLLICVINNKYRTCNIIDYFCEQNILCKMSIQTNDAKFQRRSLENPSFVQLSQVRQCGSFRITIHSAKMNSLNTAIICQKFLDGEMIHRKNKT
jgi:hypothetical protein